MFDIMFQRMAQELIFSRVVTRADDSNAIVQLLIVAYKWYQIANNIS